MPADGYASIAQEDFSAGAFPRHEVVPANGAEDIVNGVLAEDGSVFARGGSSYVGTYAASNTRPFYNLWAGHLGSAGQVVLASKTQGTTVITQGFAEMIGAATDFTGLFASIPEAGPQRPTSFAGMVALVGPPVGVVGGVTVLAWGGATAADLGPQTVSLTADSRVVNGSATTFTALQPGMLMHNDPTTGDRVGVVESIQSNTQLTLMRPWPNTNTIAVNFTKTVEIPTAENTLPYTPGQTVYAASMYERLILGRGNRLTFTAAGDPFAVLNPDDFHEIPYGASIVGMEPLRDQLMVFTTAGVFAVGGLGYDLTDAAGNVQQRLDHVAPNLVLWDNRGIAGWRGAIVAPCVDDVYVFEGGAGSRPIGGGMRRLYRSYVDRGFQAGQAAVFAGLYVLPVVSGNDWVDTLVCDLRSGAWTRWDGNGAAASAFATVVGGDTREPRLFALGAQGTTRRVHELTSALDQDGSDDDDADGSGVSLKITTRTLSVPRGEAAQTWRKLRARWELSGSPTVTLERAEGKPGGTFTTISSPRVRTDDAESIYTWAFTERSRAIRYRMTVSASSQRATLRAFDTSFRQSGKP